MTDITKGNIFQIRNRICCGFGNTFYRNGMTYVLGTKGRLRYRNSTADQDIQYFDIPNWYLQQID